MSWQLRSVLLVAWASATCALPAGTKLKAPRNWRTTFDLISELRADRTAVVDQMGTEAITKAATAEDAPFHALVSLMLSSQTKDTAGGGAGTFRRVPKGDVDSASSARAEEVTRLDARRSV